MEQYHHRVITYSYFTLYVFRYTYYGATNGFDKIHLKEAIVTWLEMHSFRYFDTFEFVKLSKRRAKMKDFSYSY